MRTILSTKPRFIDLFAGIGGMRRAFEDVGGQCVYTSEWNDFARQTYARNFDVAHHPFTGDITKVDAREVVGHDILVAGFPCQPFSIAGVSKKTALGRHHGFRDETQGTLFFDVARIIQHHRPEAFLLENVKNLVSHDRGNTFRVIMRTLEEELGYNVSWGVIDGSHWVPQHRERTFIIGFRDRPKLDFRSISRPSNTPPTLKSILHSSAKTGSWKEEPEARFTQATRAIALQKYGLTDHLWGYLQGYAQKHRDAGNGFGCSVFKPGERARTLSARYYKDGSEILIYRGKEITPRRLTPRECARLMGFDTRDTPVRERFIIEVSDTQAYKQFGNSVIVPAVRAVAAAMMDQLNGVAVPLPEPVHLPFSRPRIKSALLPVTEAA